MSSQEGNDLGQGERKFGALRLDSDEPSGLDNPCLPATASSSSDPRYGTGE